MVSNSKWRDKIGYKESVFYSKGDEALEQIDQRGGGCPILGDIHSQDGSGPGQSDLAVLSLI